MSQHAYGCASQSGDDTPTATNLSIPYCGATLVPVPSDDEDDPHDAPPPLDNDSSGDEFVMQNGCSDDSDDDKDALLPDWVMTSFKDAERLVGLAEPRDARTSSSTATPPVSIPTGA